ncbi:hypothetical protein ACFQ36_01430 [Arthrobacter sp. GCM10027362]|uniref:hypothetical protein n=1 Tax=Arthrobacter sp. GCM10027362 TaxID=3273379 RepID=UPI003641E041
MELSVLNTFLKQRRRVGDNVLVSITSGTSGAYDPVSLHLALPLRDAGIPLTPGDGEFLALVPDDEQVIHAISELLGAGACIGCRSDNAPLAVLHDVLEQRSEAGRPVEQTAPGAQPLLDSASAGFT